MRFTTKSFRVVFTVVGLLMVSVAGASNLTITSYEPNEPQDYRNDDSTQVNMAYGGVAMVEFASVDGGDPIAFGSPSALSDAVGTGNPGGLVAGNNWHDTSIDYTFNTTSPWYKGFTLKDITIYVYPATDERARYDFFVQYVSADDPNNYWDAVNTGTANWSYIQDLTVPPLTGTKIAITDINVPNVSRVRIWAKPVEAGFGNFSTAIEEIDIHITDCAEYPLQDINLDCLVNMNDLAILARDWLKDM